MHPFAIIVAIHGHLDVHVTNSEWFSRYHLSGAAVVAPGLIQANVSHRDIVSDDLIYRDGFQSRDLRIELVSAADGSTTVYARCEFVSQKAVECLDDLGQH